MANGVTALEKTLIGVELSAGSTTDVVTTHWRGTGKIKDRQERVYPPERVGRVGGTTRSYVARTGGEIPLETEALSFEQLPYILNAGIYSTTPTTDTGSGYVWTWNVQSASTDAYATTDLATLVIESGDNNDVEIARYCFVREFTVSGKQGEALTLSSVLQSRAPSTSSGFTAVGSTDLENPCEAIIFSKCALYVDDSTGTAGSTALTETILDMTLKHTTGWVELPARDSRLDFSSIKHIDDEIMLDVTFEHNTNAASEKAKYRAGTERVIRLQFAGSTLTSGGTYTTKLYRMDLYGSWMTFGNEGLEEQDGDNILKATFRCAYSPSADKKATYIVVNEVQTLP